MQLLLAVVALVLPIAVTLWIMRALDEIRASQRRLEAKLEDLEARLTGFPVA